MQALRTSTFLPVRRLALIALLALAGLVARAPIAAAQPAPPAAPSPSPDDETLYSCKKKSGSFVISFKPETELKDLITWVMSFTCKNFIYDSSLLSRTKKVTIVAPNKMTPQQAYALFLDVLNAMGVTTVPKGNVIKLVESASAKKETVPIYRRGTPPNRDEIVRYVLRPSYMSPDLMNSAVSIAASKDAEIRTVGSSVIITDYASHIRDMIALARELDKPSANEGIYTIRLENADAKDVATKLTEILGVGQAAAPSGGKGGSTDAGPGSAVPSKILVDERSNTLIVVATEAGYLRARALAKRIDELAAEAGGSASGSIHVYPLENAMAEELSTTLTTALQGGSSSSSASAGGGGRRPAAAAAPASGPAAQLGASLEGQVRVTHDAATNSLVISATGRDFFVVRDVIRKLDMPRRQVYIEAVILEVQMGNALDLGTSSHGGYPTDGGGVLLGGVQTPDLRSTSLSSLLTASGLIGGLIGPPLANGETLGLGTTFPSYAMLFQALARTSNTNILSSPFIMATDNQEAELSVGQNIPYQSTLGGAALGAAAGLTSLAPSIQREKLNLTLKIKPHVNASDMVRLEIDQEIKDIGERDAELGPTWTERKIKSQVVVRDQQSIVIGGLMQDRVVFSEAKVPLLGDIPILGYLFKYTTKEKRKTNLLVLLTPYVVKDQMDIQDILERKARERSEFMRAFGTLDSMKYLPRLDYRRKRGLIEEINRTIEGITADTELLRAMEANPGVPDGAIQVDGKDDGPPDGTPINAEPAAPTPTPSTSADGAAGSSTQAKPEAAQ